MVQSESQSHRAARVLPTALLLLLAAGGYAAIVANAFRNGSISFAETPYLIKSWWYVTGTLTPYTATDSTWTTPLYFYVVGWWQALMGIGAGPARALSIGLGLLNAGFLFAICRRLTGNVLAASAGVLLLLATPTIAFNFATAVPTALLSLLHLAAIWLVVSSLGKPRIGASIVFGLLCAAMYFTRQNMILAIIMLAPLYIAAIGSARVVHSAIVAASIAAVTAALLFLFPDKLAGHALHLPIITPYLERWHLLPFNLTLIDQGTTGATTMSLALDRLSLAEFVNGFVLPFFGIILLDVLLFFVAGRGLRLLWIVPIYVLALTAGNVLGTAGVCTDACLPGYGATFMPASVLSASLSLAVLAARARKANVSPAFVIAGGAIIATILSVFAPALATRDAYMSYPAPLVSREGDQFADVDKFAQWLATSTPMGEPILLIHDMPLLPYAVFRAARTFPVQNINPTATYRVVRPVSKPETREAIKAAIEAESLWTDDTMRRWLERDYELVLVQAKNDNQAMIAPILAARFDVAGTTTFRGVPLTLYKRKPAQ
jgi:hypothetical protein